MSGRLILHMSISLDGCSAPGAGPGSASGDARQRASLEMLRAAGIVAMGRHAAEEMAPAWSGSDSRLARRINALPKVVFSGSLDALDWENTTVNAGPIEAEIPRLKEKADGDLVVFGGPRFARSLIAADLVDEYRLTVHPATLGDGVALLPGPRRFAFVGATVYADGSILEVLRPAPM